MIIQRVIIALIIITAIATPTAYFIYANEKPWLAFYVACCGGMLLFNFLVSLYLIRKNIKGGGRNR